MSLCNKNRTKNLADSKSLSSSETYFVSWSSLPGCFDSVS